MSASGTVSFALGTGRCGTNFLYKVLSQEPHVASAHEKHPFSDTFHRYCKWYNLPVDHEGFLAVKRESIEDDLKAHRLSFESSAFLSLSVKELYDAFSARFILLVRSPEKVINSYIKKGWYENPIRLADPDKLPSFQPCDQHHHFLGRTLPKGNEFTRWKEMSQVGKLAWFWKKLNNEVLEQFKTLPSSHTLVIKLEELSFATYRDSVVPFLGIESQLSEVHFNQLTEERPNSFSNVRTIKSWSDQERTEFLEEVEPLAAHIGYDTQVILSSAASNISEGNETKKEPGSIRRFFGLR